jgi:hypothetical protein
MGMPVTTGMAEAADKSFQVKEIANQAVGQSLFDRQIINVPPPILVTTEMYLLFLSHLHHGGCFFSIKCQGLLTDYVFACRHHLQRQIGMGIGRRGYDDHIDFRVLCQTVSRVINLHLGKILLSLPEPFLIKIAGCT